MSGGPAPRRKKIAFVDPATFTPHFSWKKTEGSSRTGESVFCENVSLEEVADTAGTPTYVYSRAAIGDAFRELVAGLGGWRHTVCFAVKSNGNLAILRYLAGLGSGFDIVSGGELQHLRAIGVPGKRIVFSGVGKTREEMRDALRYRPNRRGGPTGILLFNVESEAELEALLEESTRARRGGAAVPAVSIRVNPDVQAGGHPHISTGRYEHKFGLDWEQARRLYLTHRESREIRWRGISVHIGSQIVALGPFQRALRRLSGYVSELRGAGIALEYLDFGGGLGVRYTSEKIPTRKDYARMVARALRPLRLHLLLEPGRTIIGPAGVLLTRVLYVKENRGKRFVVVDSGMNDLMRPALYGAIHPITQVARGEGHGNAPRADVVGPVCETGDCFLRDWPLGEVKAGDVLAIWSAGAYGMSQTSNYNARCRPAEVLVTGTSCRIIRRRETRRDLVRNQIF
ncbi:MAG TPA: diaminopimelate decarboxylase [Candidatus Saccharimonadales bacterium]|jgi:diaminopimelate decarboxylase|nr:diaminopimelate decarboxylase [Candidatus Saccharimonadales bacterium]